MNNIMNFSFAELEEEILRIGEKKFRAKQIWQWLHQKRVSSFAEMSNLSKTLRESLESNFGINELSVQKHQVSKDKFD